MNLLDVGCGGGILTEEFTRLGCITDGVDLSQLSVKIACSHARQNKLNIRYQVGSAESLPFPNSQFDVVLCCDVLEHLTNPEAAIAEAARVLKPGGFYLFDTINRTPQSYLETILVAQELPLTRFFPSGTHDWRQFIPPDQLTAILQNQNLVLKEFRGLMPGITIFEIAFHLFQLKLGCINFAEFGRRLQFKIGRNLSVSYIGYAQKM